MQLRVIVLLVLLSAVIAAVPFASGLYIESGYQHELATLGGQSAVNVHLSNVSYQRGWRESQVRTAVALDTLEGTKQFVLVQRIEHGPGIGLQALAQVHTSVEFPEPLKAKVREVFGDQVPLSATTLVAFDGSSTTTLTSPAIDTQLPGRSGAQVELSWEGMNGTLLSTPAGAVQVQMSIGRLEAVQGATRFELTPIDVKADMQHQGNGLWSGDSRIAMDSISLAGDPSVGQLLIKGIVMSNQQRLDNAEVSARGMLDIDKVNVSGFEAEKLGYAVSVSHLDAAALTELNRSINALASAPPAQTQAVAEQLRPQMLALLSHQPEFAIERLHFASMVGRMNTSLMVRYHGDPQTLADQTAPARLLNDVDVSLAVDASKDLVQLAAQSTASNQVMQETAHMEEPPTPEEVQQQVALLAQQQLQMAVAQNWLVENADGYSTRVVLKDGHLVINGQPSDQLLGIVPGATAPSP